MLIDMHSHVTPFDFPPAPHAGVASRWPCMQCVSSVEATLMIGDRAYRKLDARSWDAERRLADMAEAAIDMQLLSPMPELLSYWLDTDDAQLICDRVNRQIADIVVRHPGSFRGLAAVPLQDVDRAIAYLSRVRAEFGLSGIEIGSNINGALLGEPGMDPFFEAAAAMGMPIFVHALHPVATKAISVDAMYDNFFGFHVEIGMTAASLLMAGTLERHPGLRIAMSHGGGSLLAGLGRLDRGWTISKGFGRDAALPSSTARRIFYDSNSYDPAQLARMVDQVGSGRIFGGTDYPYAIAQPQLGTYLAAAGLGEDALADLRHRAASAFLGETLGGA